MTIAGEMAMLVRQKLIIFLVYFCCRVARGSPTESNGNGERGWIFGNHRRVLCSAELYEGSLDIGGACVYAGYTLPRRGSSPRNRGKFTCLVMSNIARVFARLYTGSWNSNYINILDLWNYYINSIICNSRSNPLVLCRTYQRPNNLIMINFNFFLKDNKLNVKIIFLSIHT